MKHIYIFDQAGSFSENKDVGREIRIRDIMPSLEKDEQVILDFEGVETATQSFIHSLISDPLRKYKNRALERIGFKSCNENVKQIIKIVVDYMQDAEEPRKSKHK